MALVFPEKKLTFSLSDCNFPLFLADEQNVQIEEEAAAPAAGGRTGSRDGAGGEQTKQEIEERYIFILLS
jgi:hypothetical protein